ncbi:hypothetical protein [Photobacterium leiognathi]|uniref:hypothetical protein n=1 Tax=Photobacterium leiognathi TaxID=553611 RepID=UPI00298111EF|nr:hypothetical protein [Photobacterium leiognathi]
MMLYDDLKKVDNALRRAKEMLKQAREGTFVSVNYSFKPARSRFDNEPVIYQSVSKQRSNLSPLVAKKTDCV